MTEIERTFIVKDINEICVESDYGYIIKQYYTLKNNENEIRFRAIFDLNGIDCQCFLTLKQGQGVVRGEQEFEIPYNIYKCYRKEKVGAVVKKCVREHVINDIILVCNIVNDELHYIDVEFSNLTDAKNFNILDYISKDNLIEEVNKEKPKEYLNEKN